MIINNILANEESIKNVAYTYIHESTFLLFLMFSVFCSYFFIRFIFYVHSELRHLYYKLKKK